MRALWMSTQTEERCYLDRTDDTTEDLLRCA
jgi:hypothetical protein